MYQETQARLEETEQGFLEIGSLLIASSCDWPKTGVRLVKRIISSGCAVGIVRAFEEESINSAYFV